MLRLSPFPELAISAFGYNLPDEKIARFPLEKRDGSKLLVWNAGRIQEGVYAGLAGFLPAPSLLVFNNSRVIEARIIFQKKTGAEIEIFCLEPHAFYSSISSAMLQTGRVYGPA